MLENIDLNGTSALDFSAMEGTISTVMAKRGASVFSTDVINRSEQVTLVQRAHEVQLSYFPELPLHRVAEAIFDIQSSKAYTHGAELGPTEKTNFGFDVVVSSGVMYHVMNPVEHLITYRKLCKLDGLVVIETAAAISDDILFFHAMRPNGTLYNGFATWFITTAALDLFLRACYLEPLASCYVSREKFDGIETARVGVIARSVSKQPFDPITYKRHNEVWNSEIYNNKDFAGLRPAALLTGRATKLLNLRMEGIFSATNGIPVSAFNDSDPLPYTNNDLRLSL